MEGGHRKEDVRYSGKLRERRSSRWFKTMNVWRERCKTSKECSATLFHLIGAIHFRFYCLFWRTHKIVKTEHVVSSLVALFPAEYFALCKKKKSRLSCPFLFSSKSITNTLHLLCLPTHLSTLPTVLVQLSTETELFNNSGFQKSETRMCTFRCVLPL